MSTFTHEEWKRIADSFSKAAPSSPHWFAQVDAIITYMLQDKLAETRPVVPNGDRQ